MNDPIRTRYLADLGIRPPGTPHVGPADSASDRSFSVDATLGSESRTSSMASLRSTMPPPPAAAPEVAASQAEASEAQSAAQEPEPLAGIDTQAIQKGLESAEKVGVKAAKLTFWGKLAGAVVTGLAIVAFGIATGGAGPLAIAGLALTSAYFLKSCADVHMARLQLQNAKAQEAGQPPPHRLPCGADALAHVLYTPFSKWATKGIDPSDTEALGAARQKAKNWAKGVSTGVDLALGVSAVAVTGAATGKIGESLGALGVRVLCNVLTSMVVRTPPEIYQEKSLELARRDLTHVEQQLQSIDIGNPPTSNDPDALAMYLEKYQIQSALQERFEGVKNRFEAQLEAYRAGILGVDMTRRADMVDGLSAVLGAGSDATDFTVGAIEHVPVEGGALTSIAVLAMQLTRSASYLKKQKGLEDRLLQALLEMDKDLKRVNKDILEFTTMLGMVPPEFPTQAAQEDDRLLADAIRVLAS